MKGKCGNCGLVNWIGSPNGFCSPGCKSKYFAALREFEQAKKIRRGKRKRKKKKTKTVSPVPSQKPPVRVVGFYESDEWRLVRYEALKFNDGRCALCGHGRSDGVKLHVDHIKPRSKYPKLELSLSNLQVLCENCNAGKGARHADDWR